MQASAAWGRALSISNNLLGYPHGLHNSWSDFIPVDAAELARIFAKRRGKQVQNYFVGSM